MNMKVVIDIYKKYKELIKYLFVGVATTIVSLIIYYVCVLTVFDPKKAIELQIANIMSWIGAVIFAYITNRKFVFESKNPNIIKEIIAFVGARLLTLFMDMFLMFFLVTCMNVNDKISKLLVQCIVMVANYLFSKILVFRKQQQGEYL